MVMRVRREAAVGRRHKERCREARLRGSVSHLVKLSKLLSFYVTIPPGAYVLIRSPV
jgi:hypothetical protein